MRIKIWASVNPKFPDLGPYKMLDIVEKDAPYSVGEMTHYGAVIIIPPPGALSGEGVDQSVIVKLNPASLTARPDESVFEKPPYSYDKIEFFPIHVDRHGYWTTNPPKGTYPILDAENLTIEDVSSIIKPNTFSVWARDCSLSKATVSALQGVTYAIVHRYTTNNSDRDAKLDSHSTELVNMAVACLSLIRPTRRSRAGNMRGLIKADGMFDPQDFTAHDPAEVPEVQKLFTIENQDIDLLRSVLPEFIKL